MQRSFAGPSLRFSSILLLLLATLLAMAFAMSSADPAQALRVLPACANNLDDDSDGWIDFPVEPGCTSGTDVNEAHVPGSTQCTDGLDNEVAPDGRIDYPADPGCRYAATNDETDTTVPQCADGNDNDADGLGDYAGVPFLGLSPDPNCISASDTMERTRQCNDGIDNDGDGKTDFPADFGCAVPNSGPDQNDNDERDPPQCNDGRDNDGDGWLDHNTNISGQTKDPGCVDQYDNSESPNPACSDGADNDGDGRVDFPVDAGCTSREDGDETDPPGTPPQPPPPACADTIDNDLDGRIDFPADPGCTATTDTDETDPPKPTTASSTPPPATPPPPPPPVVTTASAVLPISPFPVVRLRGRADRRGVLITLLRVQSPRGTKVTIYCKGRTCPLRRKSETTITGFVRPKQFERRLRAGTTLTIYVTRTGFIGKYTRFKIMRNRAPSRVDSCARFAGTKPVPCPIN